MSVKQYGSTLACTKFECISSDTCINHNGFCELQQECPAVRLSKLCGMCLVGAVCPDSIARKKVK